MLTTKKEISDWLYRNSIDYYTINDDLTVDVDGSVHIRNKGLLELPIQFGVVNGHFDCSSNYLYTLKGSPTKVNGMFNCGQNDLTNLYFSPTFVKDNFLCKLLPLFSLKDFQCDIGGYFFHSYKNNNPDIIEELKDYYQPMSSNETMVKIDAPQLKAVMLNLELNKELNFNKEEKIKKTKI